MKSSSLSIYIHNSLKKSLFRNLNQFSNTLFIGKQHKIGYLFLFPKNNFTKAAETEQGLRSWYQLRLFIKERRKWKCRTTIGKKKMTMMMEKLMLNAPDYEATRDRDSGFRWPQNPKSRKWASLEVSSDCRAWDGQPNAPVVCFPAGRVGSPSLTNLSLFCFICLFYMFRILDKYTARVGRGDMYARSGVGTKPRPRGGSGISLSFNLCLLLASLINKKKSLNLMPFALYINWWVASTPPSSWFQFFLSPFPFPCYLFLLWWT